MKIKQHRLDRAREVGMSEQQHFPFVVLLSSKRLRERSEIVVQSPRVVAARLDAADKAVLRLIAKLEHPIDGCTLRVGRVKGEGVGMTKRLNRSRSTILKAIRRLEALGLVGYANGQRDGGSQRSTHRFLNQQLLHDIGRSDLAYDEKLRDPQLDVAFEPLPEVGEILAKKRSLGRKDGTRKTLKGGVIFSNHPGEDDTPDDTPMTPLEQYYVLQSEHPSGAIRTEEVEEGSLGVTSSSALSAETTGFEPEPSSRTDELRAPQVLEDLPPWPFAGHYPAIDDLVPSWEESFRQARLNPPPPGVVETWAREAHERFVEAVRTPSGRLMAEYLLAQERAS